jgi:mannose-1-phosphate guanylyltransferase/mannose-6-phosphate isomerase
MGLESDGKIIQEPSGRNTAPAILLAAFHIHQAAPEGIMCVFPADHVIGNIPLFHDRLRAAIELADRGNIVTFGIKPNYPETGYGYIEAIDDGSQSALRVRRFVEKPDRPTAEKYIEAGNFFWNSGMFAFKVSVLLAEFKTHQLQMLTAMESMFTGDRPPTVEDYDQLENTSIDYAIMEKTDKCVVVPSDFGWSDIGSWKSLYDFLEKDADYNVIDGDVIARDTRNCFIQGHDRLIATNRLQEIVVVETPDSVFVSDLEHSRDVKSIVSELKRRGRKEYQQHRTVHRPWGISKLLEQSQFYTAAELTVYPDSSLEIPYDEDRIQHLIIIRGEVNVKSASRDKSLNTGESFTWYAEGEVRIWNKGADEVHLVQMALART